MDKKWLIVIIVALLITTIGTTAYIIYDKANTKEPDKTEPEKDKEKEPDSGKDKEEKEPNINIDKNTNIAIFPKNDNTAKTYYTIGYTKDICDSTKEDCTFIDASTDFKDRKINADGMTIETSCEKYVTDGPDSYCDKSTINIDDKIKYDLQLGYIPGKSKTIIAKTEKYYIIEDIENGYPNGTLTIYDLKGKKVKEIDNINAGFVTGSMDEPESNSKYDGFEMVLNDNFLYYATTDNYEDYKKNPDKYKDDNVCKNYVHFYYMDLDKLQSVEISKVCATTAEQLP